MATNIDTGRIRRISWIRIEMSQEGCSEDSECIATARKGRFIRGRAFQVILCNGSFSFNFAGHPGSCVLLNKMRDYGNTFDSPCAGYY